MRVLLAEDDPLLGDGLQRALRSDGYTVDWVVRGDQVAQALGHEHFDLLLLDIGLPGRDGLQVLQKLRSGEPGLPVIIISARDRLNDRVEGLDSGADDYLVKPFELDELRARMRACLRRAESIQQEVIQVGEVCVQPAAMQVSVNGEDVSLPRREFTLLVELVRNRGRVLTRERLEQALYGWSGEVESNTLEVHIHHLRRKLGNEFIRTVRGVGYMIPDVAG